MTGRPVAHLTRPRGHQLSSSVEPRTTLTQRPSLQLMTQNVQGLAKTSATLEGWFDSFRSRRAGFQVDVILLQETRATERWSAQLSTIWVRSWGYDPLKYPHTLSYWPATSSAAGGVAILLAPSTALVRVAPWQQAAWSPHFVAISGSLGAEMVTIINIYGPAERFARERLFKHLATLPIPPGLIILGGDFNCTLDAEFDRSYLASTSHHSPALVELLSRWHVVDSVTRDTLQVQSTHDLQVFRQNYHTYAYPLPDGMLATARLDRWYVSGLFYRWVQGVFVETPEQRSDHDAVRLVLGSDARPPSTDGSKRPPSLKFPLPACAAAAVLEAGRSLLLERGPSLQQLTPRESALGWDSLKTEVRRTSLVTRRERLAAASRSRREKTKRLHRALRDAKVSRHLVALPADVTITELTECFASLKMDPAGRYKSLRRSLIAFQAAGLARRQLKRHAKHAGSAQESTKALFRRISVKYTAKGVARMPPRPGSSQTSADWIADDWRPITQCDPCDARKQAAFFSQLPRKPSDPALNSVDEAFTETEVAAAIRSCPRGKACGPDGLPNGWYRDNEEAVAEILAPLFTQWYQSGELPASFKAASIYCIPKQTQPKSGLDFRPIALLNTDYKIYARVLLNGVRAHIPSLVSSTQFGFVPARQVHDALDIWSALQLRAQRGELPPTALAILLDFAKAYDSLDRNFLQRALKWHGFTPRLIHAIHVMHLGTTASYLAEDSVSGAIDVTTGIRHGCPLAPSLFVLAVDTLYAAVRAAGSLPGLDLSASTKVSIVGFADDTTVYLRSAEETRTLQLLLNDFAEVSGLRVNVAKSIGVCLLETSLAASQHQSVFPIAPATQLARYLGGQIATRLRQEAVWDLVLQQLQAKLHLAAVKTTDFLQRVHIAQAVIVPKILFVARHVWPTARQIGLILLKAAASTPFSTEERSAVLSLLQVTGRASPAAGAWRDGRYHRDYASIYPQLKAIRRLQRERAGRLNVKALLHAPLLGADLLLHHSGRPLRASDMPDLEIGSKTVSDAVDIHWVNSTTLSFRPRGLEYPHPGDRNFRTLCDLLVMTYPELLLPHDPMNRLSEVGRSTDIWYLEPREGAVHLLQEVVVREFRDLGPVKSIQQAESIARRASGKPRLCFFPHPALSPVLPFWGSASLVSKRSLRTTITELRCEKVTSELAARCNLASAASPTFGLALDEVPWSDIHDLEHSSSRQRLAFHKVKGQRVTGWDWVMERRGCPHCPSLNHAGGSTYHTVWSCQAAQLLWKQVRAWWAGLGLWHDRSASTTDNFIHAIFSLRLPRTPPRIWEFVSLHQSRQKKLDSAPDPFPVLQAVWQQLVLETLVFILAWRRRRGDGDRPWSPQQALTLHDAACYRVMSTILTHLSASECSSMDNQPDFQATLVAELRETFRRPPQPPPPAVSASTATFLLFFDGGSRGNPGPGGSSAVLVRAEKSSGSATILWSAAISYASAKTTNNQAEYRGLLTGLQAATTLQLPSLVVIGDSALILRQLREHRPPRNRTLLDLYQRARPLADALGIDSWIHHYRTHNKMADAMANLAMDSQASAQVLHPTSRGGHSDLPDLLSNDLLPWWTSPHRVEQP